MIKINHFRSFCFLISMFTVSYQFTTTHQPTQKLGYNQGICRSSTPCQTSLTCSNGRCVCTSSQYYDSSTATCKNKLGYNGRTCTTNTMCKTSLSCVNGKCLCLSSQYYDFSRCRSKRFLGSSCDRPGQCIDIFVCLNSLCGCNDGMFYDIDTDTCQNESEGLSAAVIAGIAVATVVVVGLIVGTIICIIRRRRSNQRQTELEVNAPDPAKNTDDYVLAVMDGGDTAKSDTCMAERPKSNIYVNVNKMNNGTDSNVNKVEENKAPVTGEVYGNIPDRQDNVPVTEGNYVNRNDSPKKKIPEPVTEEVYENEVNSRPNNVVDNDVIEDVYENKSDRKNNKVEVNEDVYEHYAKAGGDEEIYSN